MNNPFFDHPILNSPYDYPRRHWELDSTGQPTQRTVEARRKAEFITPIPRPRKQKGKARQQNLSLDDSPRWLRNSANRQSISRTPEERQPQANPELFRLALKLAAAAAVRIGIR